jgi:hypothetical protein
VNLKVETSFYWVSFPLQLVRFWRHDHVMYRVRVTLWLVRKREGNPWEGLALQCISSSQIHHTFISVLIPCKVTLRACKCRYGLFQLIRIMYRRADNSWPVSFTVCAWVSLCYELISSAERNKQTALDRSTQCTNNSDNTSMCELLLRQNSVTAHAHQS